MKPYERKGLCCRSTFLIKVKENKTHREEIKSIIFKGLQPNAIISYFNNYKDGKSIIEHLDIRKTLSIN